MEHGSKFYGNKKLITNIYGLPKKKLIYIYGYKLQSAKLIWAAITIKAINLIF